MHRLDQAAPSHLACGVGGHPEPRGNGVHSEQSRRRRLIRCVGIEGCHSQGQEVPQAGDERQHLPRAGRGQDGPDCIHYLHNARQVRHLRP